MSWLTGSRPKEGPRRRGRGGPQGAPRGDAAGIKTAGRASTRPRLGGASLYDAANAAGATQADGTPGPEPSAGQPRKTVDADYEIVMRRR